MLSCCRYHCFVSVVQWSFGGFFIVSYIFGLGVWMYGFLVTYQFWGGTGTFIGLLLGVVGVVPLGIIAAALHGTWYYVGELIIRNRYHIPSASVCPISDETTGTSCRRRCKFGR